MEPTLAAQFPEVKSYRGQGVDDPAATTRFDWSPLGFHALVLSTQGSVCIEPYTAGDARHYITFFKEDLQDGFNPPRCEASGELRDSIERKLDNGELSALSVERRSGPIGLRWPRQLSTPLTQPTGQQGCCAHKAEHDSQSDQRDL